MTADKWSQYEVNPGSSSPAVNGAPNASATSAPDRWAKYEANPAASRNSPVLPKMTDPSGNPYAPSDMSDAGAKLKQGYKVGPPEQQPEPPPMGLPDVFGKVNSGVVDAVKGVAQIPGQVKQAFTAPPTPAENAEDGTQGPPSLSRRIGLAAKRMIADPMSAELQKGREDMAQGHISEAIGHSVAGALPLFGPFAAHTGEAIGNDPVRGGAELAVNMAVPKVAEETGSIAGTAAKGAVSVAPKIAKSIQVIAKPFGNLPVLDKFVKTAQALKEVPAGLRDAWGVKPPPEAEEVNTEPPPSIYRKSGKQIQDAVTVTPRQIVTPKGLLTEGTPDVPAPAEAAPAIYRMRGDQIQDAATATPRRVLGPERQLPAAPADRPVITRSAQPAEPAVSIPEDNEAPSTVNADAPRVRSGEAVLNQALTALDNKSLIKVARSRGIDVTREAQLKPGAANSSIINKIMDDFSPDELDNARDMGVEISRNRPEPTNDLSAGASKAEREADAERQAEAWHYKVLNTFFPDVAIPKTMAARAQAVIANRPTIARTPAAALQDISAANANGRAVLPPEEAPQPAAAPKIARVQKNGTRLPQPQVATEQNMEQLLADSLKPDNVAAIKAKNQPPAEPVSQTRGQYPDLRAEFDKLSPEDQVRGHFVSDVTGLPNKKAFTAAENSANAKAYAMSDADGLKALNDKYGYEAGNALLKAKADALRETGLEAYHEKGDEFLFRGESAEDLKDKLDEANDILKNKKITVETTDGKVLKFKGAQFSHGEAENLASAETQLKASKAAREAAGERKRGKLGTIKEVK
ncbi:MAG TPA: hypothetical protein VGK24_05835 [Candidatus Angelobacter sp.]|jgi:GGDEF domain-containing protein